VIRDGKKIKKSKFLGKLGISFWVKNTSIRDLVNAGSGIQDGKSRIRDTVNIPDKQHSRESIEIEM
jgi:hypothetical protein